MKGRWFITRHAYLRMQEMGLCRADVLDLIDNAEVTYESESGRYRTIMCGSTAVVVQPFDWLVISVIPRDGGRREKLSLADAADIIKEKLCA